MKTITQGFEITGVPGVKKIIVRPIITEAMSYVEITFDLMDSDGDPTSEGSFDLDGLGEFRAGIIKAEQLAVRLRNELDEE